MSTPGFQQHCCLLYSNERDHREAIVGFVREGLARNHKILYAGTRRNLEDVTGYFTGTELDIARLLDSGQVEFVPIDKVSPDRAIEFLKAQTALAIEQGFSALRFTRDAEHAFDDPALNRAVLEYEERLNFVLGDKCLALCQYDRRNNVPEQLSAVLGAHPQVMVDSERYDNFYFTEPSTHFRSGAHLRFANRLKNLREHRQMVEALRQGTVELQGLLDGSNDGIVVLSDHGTVLQVNLQVCEWYGISREQLLGKSFFELNRDDPSKCERIKGYIATVREKGQGFFKSVQKRPDGSVFPIEINARLVQFRGSPAFLGVIRDISEREAAMAAVRESEEIFRTSFELAPDGRVVWDLDTTQPVMFNAALCRLLGYGREEFAKVRMPELDADSSTERLRSLIDQLWKAGHMTFETQIRARNGTLISVRISARALEVRGRRAANCVVYDLTELRRAEAEKERMRLQLFQSSKLASVGLLAAGVAHEINNPLTILRGNLEILRDDIESSDISKAEQLALLDKQERAILRVASIVDGLRNFTKPGSEEFREVDLNSVISDCLAISMPLYEKGGVRIEKRLLAKNQLVWGNTGKLEQVVVNLLANAHDAVESTGKGEGWIRIETADGDNEVILKVADSGVGMDEEQKERIFEPFFTTKSPNKGMGLGLSVTKSLLQSMGGRIEADSSPGTGTVFSVWLPRAIGSAQAGLQTRGEAARVSLSGSVLLVDDEPEILEILRFYLSRFGLEIAVAHDGVEAFDKLKGAAFDYVVTDLQMPRMGGREFLSKARALGLKKTRFVVITGGIGEGSDGTELALEGLADAYLRKPFTGKDVLEALRPQTEGAPR